MMIMKQIRKLMLPLALGLIAAPAMAVNNIDLSTVPARDSVQLTIYNSEDLTLVRERRLMSFKRGYNELQFSWANTLIDPSSVEIRFPDDPDAAEVVDTTFALSRPQALKWNVQASTDGAVMTEITYFTSGLTWSADYTLLASQNFDAAAMDGFIRIHNRSGEDYENAEIRVVVGQINLVEKIAELARVPVARVKDLAEAERRQLRKRAAKSMMAREDAPAPPAVGVMSMFSEPKAIIKEGLSEYFIYRIEGTETVPNGWSKRLRSFDADKVPLDLRYRYRARQYGKDLVRVALLRNDEESGLGSTPLPNGDVTVFRYNATGGLSYVARRTIKYVPIGDKLELNLGPDPDVGFEIKLLASRRDELWLKLQKANAFKKVGDGTVVIDHRAQVAGWNDTATVMRVIKNFTRQPIRVEIRRSFSGDVLWRSNLDTRRHDFKTVEVHADVPAGETAELLYELTKRNGRNSRQKRLEIESAEISRPTY